MGLRAPFCVAPAPHPFPLPSHSCAPIAWGRGGTTSMFTCRPCTQTRGVLRVWVCAPSLAPLAHTWGKGGTASVFAPPVRIATTPEPWEGAPGLGAPLVHLFAWRTKGDAPLPFHAAPHSRVAPVYKRGQGARGGLICVPPLRAGQGGGGACHFWGLCLPPTAHVSPLVGGGCAKGRGAPSHSCMGTQRGGVCPLPLSQPLPPSFHATP